ncbi:MAG: hypothetical protein Q4D82_05135 [Neisseria sp.]|nr:hypothetical protein [Neisseria sp.]
MLVVASLLMLVACDSQSEGKIRKQINFLPAHLIKEKMRIDLNATCKQKASTLSLSQDEKNKLEYICDCVGGRVSDSLSETELKLLLLPKEVLTASEKEGIFRVEQKVQNISASAMQICFQK